MSRPASFGRVQAAFEALDAGRCPRAKLLRRIIAESETNVAAIVPTEEEVARAVFIEAGKAYCVARCGGCALTEGWAPAN